MALLFMDGFEAKDQLLKYEYANGGYGGLGAGYSTTWGGGRFDTTSLGGHNWAGQGVPYLSKYFTASSKLTVGVAIYNTNPGGITCNLLSFYGDTGSTQHLLVRFVSAQIQVWCGATMIVQSPPAIVTANTWNYVEIQASIHSSTGEVILKYNGVVVGSFTGNTKNGGTNNTIDAANITFDGGGVIYVDDYYILNDTGPAPYNTFLGDVRVYAMTPNGAGSSTGFTPSSGANYTTVDELPYSVTDYISGSVTGTRDTYTMTNLPANVDNLFGLQTSVIARKTDAGSIGVKTVLRSGGTDYYGSTMPLIASDKLGYEIRSVDPSTSTDWTSSGINNLEIGVELA